MLTVPSIFFPNKENVSEWLYDLGLIQYWPSFEKNCYTDPEDLADLKSLPNKDTLGDILDIRKPAHLERLWQGVTKLQYAHKGNIFEPEMKSSKTKRSIQ